MKNVTATLIITLFSALASCSLGTIDFPDQMSYSDIEGKWSLYTNDHSISTIEFTDSRFYLMERAGETIYGRYAKTDYYQFTLYDSSSTTLATIDVTSNTSSYISFDITFDGSDTPVATAASKSSEVVMNDEDNTTYLCALWLVANITNKNYAQGDDCGCDCDSYECSCNELFGHCSSDTCSCTCPKEEQPDIDYLLFTPSGTFLQIWSDGATTQTTWQWADTDEDSIQYYVNGDWSSAMDVSASTSSAIMQYSDDIGNEYEIGLDLHTGPVYNSDYE